MKLTLTGNPVSVDQLHRGRRFLTPRGIQTKRDYRSPLEGPVQVELIVYFRSKATSDIDNVCKATLDSLTRVLYKDDRQIVD